MMSTEDECVVYCFVPTITFSTSTENVELRLRDGCLSMGCLYNHVFEPYGPCIDVNYDTTRLAERHI